MRAAEPAGDLEVAGLFGRWATEPVIALAVSGGADSLALMSLAHRWRQSLDTGPRLVVLSVDHGLRPEAATEVAAVGTAAAKLGLAFQALRGTGSAPTSDIEAAARDLRYGLLFAAARAEGATVLMTAHHADDQAETLLLRMARGSGVYGLAAMAAESRREEMRIARPLLGLRRVDLAAVVAASGLTPVSDPHNEDSRFARARLRRVMPALAGEGLDTPTLVATAARFRRAASALDDYADRLLQSAKVDVTGAVRLEVARLAAEPEETRLRVLARILRAVGGAIYGPRLDSLVELASAMTSGVGTVPARTLAGVTIERRKGELRFQREAGRAGLPEIHVAGAFEGVWDGRFIVRIVAAEARLRLAPLGDAGRRSLGACLEDGLPRAMEASPALFQDDRLIAAPILGFQAAPEHNIRAEMRSIVPLRLLDRRRIDDL
ncbi:tRNA(Ile)-lysidine synthase [Kaistia soli DSM 19436]|uniref:tRNA(Ile)-lysidine synthase n=1 Tax=Kaistia soli DSM 19436 TaxID=1122133 RepID=A0A1M5M9K4_9HYPH|nr:tRNA lysidine(34) synthetase TilS [Kaistia soli]SHG73940.1 tRNA(Ile)-lysidine synthase [Kaistia soli DSM 19436]